MLANTDLDCFFFKFISFPLLGCFFFHCFCFDWSCVCSCCVMAGLFGRQGKHEMAVRTSDDVPQLQLQQLMLVWLVFGKPLKSGFVFVLLSRT